MSEPLKRDTDIAWDERQRRAALHYVSEAIKALADAATAYETPEFQEAVYESIAFLLKRLAMRRVEIDKETWRAR